MPVAQPRGRAVAVRTTWFELVSAVADEAGSEAETLAVIEHLLASGSLRAPRTARRRMARALLDGRREGVSCSP